MNQQKISYYLNTFGMPVTLVVFGAILLLSPDSASILIANILALILNIAGIGYGIAALLGNRQRRTSHILTAVVCLLLGNLLRLNPLMLASNIGRVLGILLAVEAGQVIFRGAGSKLLGMLMLFGALVLMFAPMTASRLVFSLCGLILIFIGGAEIMEKVKKKKLGVAKDKPDIIDAE